MSKKYSETRTPQYHTNQVKDKHLIMWLDTTSSNPKMIGTSRDGKFRSFAYIPAGGCTTNAKRSIYRDYKEFKANG